MDSVVARAERLAGLKKTMRSGSHSREALSSNHTSSNHPSSRYKNSSTFRIQSTSRHTGMLQGRRDDRLDRGRPAAGVFKRQPRGLSQSTSTPPKPLSKYSVPQWTNYTPKLSIGQIKSRKPTPAKATPALKSDIPAPPTARTRTRTSKSSRNTSVGYQLGDRDLAKSSRNTSVGYQLGDRDLAKSSRNTSVGYQLGDRDTNPVTTLQKNLLKEQRKYTSMEGTHKHLKHRYDEAITDARLVKEKYKETKSKLAEMTAKLQSERTLLGRMHDEFTKLHTKHVKLHEKHDSRKKDHKQMKRENDERHSEILQHRLATERMSKELEAERSKNAELHLKLKNTAKDNEGTRTKINKAMDIIRKMKDELARYRRKHRELKAKYQVIKEKYEVAQMNHKDLAIVKQDVRRELEKEFRREIETLKRNHKEQIEKLERQLQQDRTFASNLVKSKDSYITRLQEHNRLLQQHLKLIKKALEHRLLGLEEESRAMSRDICRIRKGMAAPGAPAPPPQQKARADQALRQAEDWVQNRFSTQCYQIKRQIDTISTIVESEGPSTIRTDLTSLNGTVRSVLDNGTVRSVIQPGEAPKARNTPTPKPNLARKITPRRAPTPTVTPKRPNLGIRPLVSGDNKNPGMGGQKVGGLAW